jgi:hypothetical protein
MLLTTNSSPALSIVEPASPVLPQRFGGPAVEAEVPGRWME